MINPAGKDIVVDRAAPPLEPSQQASPSVQQQLELNRSARFRLHRDCPRSDLAAADKADSRVPSEDNGLGGAVPIENIGGRAEIVTFSLDGSATWNPLTWFTMFRSGRAGISLRP